MMRSAFFTALTAAVLCCGRSEAQLINEFAPNPTGTDPGQTMIELLGDPGASFSGVLVAFESELDNALGAVNDIYTDLTGTFDTNGLLTLTIDDFENPSFTLVLAESFSGDASTDIDADDDGSVDDTSVFINIFDAINIPDNAPDAAGVTFGSDFGGADFPFIGDEPQLVFRDSVTLEFLALDDLGGGATEGTLFDSSGNDTGLTFADGFDTFGAANPTIGASGGDLDGDFNDDDAVDAADFTVLRDQFGAPNGALPNDPNSSAIGPDQFATFVTGFGAEGGAPGVVANAVSVPEPASIGLLLIVGVWRARRRA